MQAADQRHGPTRHVTPESREPRWPHGIGQWPHEIVPSEPPRGVVSNESARRQTTERRRERTVRPPQAIWSPPHDTMRAHPQDNAALSRVEISSYPRVDIALNPVTYSNWYVKARVHSMKDAFFSFIGCVRWKSAYERFSTVCLWKLLSSQSFSQNWNCKFIWEGFKGGEIWNVNRQ